MTSEVTTSDVLNRKGISMLLHDVRHDLVSSAAGPFAVQRTQEIPSEFLDDLRDDRSASGARAGEMHRVASVPVALVELWLAEGFDIYREPASAIVRRLEQADLGAFITTTKRV